MNKFISRFYMMIMSNGHAHKSKMTWNSRISKTDYWVWGSEGVVDNTEMIQKVVQMVIWFLDLIWWALLSDLIPRFIVWWALPKRTKEWWWRATTTEKYLWWANKVSETKVLLHELWFGGRQMCTYPDIQFSWRLWVLLMMKIWSWSHIF